MLCCVGLVGGGVVGQALGGPWTFIGPAAGFGIGLLVDMKMMKRVIQKAGPQQHDIEFRAKGAEANGNAEKVGQAPGGLPAAAPAAESASCCGAASGLMRMLGIKGKKEKGEMTLAEIRKTYETESSEPPVRG